MVERVSIAFEKLTPREREILRLIAAHLQSKEIARALGLSPKTVEMHVLSARRRLSGMSRRDAALAFVAWEESDPGNDYRKRPDSLAVLSSSSLPDREIGDDDERKRLGAFDPLDESRPRDFRGHLRAAFEDLVGGADDHDLSVGRPTAGRDWRHELTNLQWLGLILVVTAATAVLLAVTAIGLHEFIRAVERIMSPHNR